MLDQNLAIRLEAVEAWGISQYAETVKKLYPWIGAEVLHGESGISCFVGVGTPLTCITGMGMKGEVTPEEMDRMERFLTDKEVVPVVKFCPMAHPSLMDQLQRRGYVPTEFINTLYIQLAADFELPEVSEEIEVSIANAEEGELWSRTVAQGFRGTESQTWDSIPQDDIGTTIFHEEVSVCVLARVAGVPAGGGAMSLNDGVAALFAASTIPAHRNRGVHRALIRKRLEIAQAAGCDLVRFEAALDSASHRNAEHVGFRVAYTRIWMKKRRNRKNRITSCLKRRNSQEKMPTTPHIEKHFTATENVRDIVIGMSDGLTVPFALAAGLTGAIVNSGIVVTAGLAEIVAGSIAMGLGGYLAAKTDAEHYHSELAREYEETQTLPDREREEVAEVFRGYGLAEDQIVPVVDAISSNRDHWVDFMMKYELGLEKPDPKRALVSALTIAGAYIAGGFIPLCPYMFIQEARQALVYSIIVTMLALIIFGYVKGRFTGTKPFKSALQTVLTGGLAAAAAFMIARAIS